MKYVLILLALSASNMAAVPLCTFDKETISDFFSRFETFRKAKKIDIEIRSSGMTSFHFSRKVKDSSASITYKNDVLLEYFDWNNLNDVVTINGTLRIMNGPRIKYERESEGIFSFENLKNGKKLKLNILNLDDAPDDAFGNIVQQSDVDFISKVILLRKILFYNRDFFLRDFEQITYLEYNIIREGELHVLFSDKMDRSVIAVFIKYENNITITRQKTIQPKMNVIYKCGKKCQKANIVDGQVCILGELYVLYMFES